MAEHNCKACKFRKKYDNNPKSILGRIWKWHTKWCPGWKEYITSLPEKEKVQIAKKYNMIKF